MGRRVLLALAVLSAAALLWVPAPDQSLGELRELREAPTWLPAPAERADAGANAAAGGANSLTTAAGGSSGESGAITLTTPPPVPVSPVTAPTDNVIAPPEPVVVPVTAGATSATGGTGGSVTAAAAAAAAAAKAAAAARAGPGAAAAERAPSAAPSAAPTSQHARWLAPRVARAGGPTLRAAVLVTGTPGALGIVSANHAWGLPGSRRVSVDVFLVLSVGVQDPDSLEGPSSAAASQQDALNMSGAYREALLAAGVTLAHVSAEPDEPPRADANLRQIKVASGSSQRAMEGQLSSLSRALRVLRAHEVQHGFRYDVVARLRTDIVFLAPLGPLLSRAAEERAARVGAAARCIVPRYGKYFGVHDRVAVMDREAAEAYFEVRLAIVEQRAPLVLPDKRFRANAECFLLAALVLAKVTIVESGDIAANVARTGCISYTLECSSLDGYPRAFEKACKGLRCGITKAFTMASQLALESNWRAASATPRNASDWVSFPTPTCPGVVAWLGDEPVIECCLSSRDYQGREEYSDGYEGKGNCLCQRCAHDTADPRPARTAEEQGAAARNRSSTP
jgi:hypothetical protein